MTDSLDRKTLRDLPVFAGLDDEQLAKVASICRRVDVDTGGELLKQGEPAEDLRVVLDGKFSLCLELGGGREECLLTLTRGEVIGWSAVLDQSTWLASATALKPSTVLDLPGRAVRELCEQDHDIGYHLMRNLFTAVTARLHDTRLQLLDMYGAP